MVAPVNAVGSRILWVPREAARVAKREVGADRVEDQEAGGEHEDDHEHPPPQALAQRIADDRGRRPELVPGDRVHPVLPPTASR